MHHPGPHHAPPPRRHSRLFRFLAITLALFLMPIFVFGATVAATGTIVVSVHEPGPNGVNLWIPVPALLLDVAIFAAPRLMPREALAEVRRELAPFRESIESMAHELESVPAGSVLVEVESGKEHVVIAKDWRNFEISVDSDDTDVRVSVPARLLSRSLDLLGG